MAHLPGRVQSAFEVVYYFGASAGFIALDAASFAAVAASLAASAAAPAAVAAAPAASAAAAGADSAAGAAAAGADSAAGASAAGAGGASVLAQPPSTSAATKALRASLVFIYRYPRKFKEEKQPRQTSLSSGFTQIAERDFRGFCYNFKPVSNVIYSLLLSLAPIAPKPQNTPLTGVRWFGVKSQATFLKAPWPSLLSV